HKHYNTSNLLDTKIFLAETFHNLIETQFKLISEIEVTQLNTTIHNKYHNFYQDVFHFERKTTHNGEDYNTCIINYKLLHLKDINFKHLEVNNDLIEEIAITKELKIYALLNDNSSLIYLVLKKFFEPWSKCLSKIIIYQVGLRTVDEAMYT